jgi:hypothetical protein
MPQDKASGSDNIAQLGNIHIQLDLSPHAMSQLAELKEKTDAAS